MSANIINMRGVREAPRNTRSKMETLLVSPQVLEGWALPGFQRELRENEKVRNLSEEIKANGGFIPGIITLGMLSGDKVTYLLDGQHRRHGALMSGLPEFIVDVRICTFDDMAEMGEEYVQLNSSLVKMRPDDILRGLESSIPALVKIRKACPFVGYDQVRRGVRTGSSTILGMSSAIRFWRQGSFEAPNSGQANSAISIIKGMEASEVDDLIRFLTIAKQAWGDDPEYYRLWAGLNMSLCVWFFHAVVLRKERGVKRSVLLSGDQFRKCMMSVSASSDYVDWLLGRILGERDRAPCYSRLKAIFASRLREDTGSKPLLPHPSWATK